jgi:hypothetical protein
MNNSLNIFSKYFLRLSSIAFTYLFAALIISMFECDMDFSLITKLFCLFVGIISNVGFFLSTLEWKKRMKWIIAILLVPTIIVNFGFIRMVQYELIVAIVWAMFMGLMAFYQLFKKRGIINEKSD